MDEIDDLLERFKKLKESYGCRSEIEFLEILRRSVLLGRMEHELTESNRRVDELERRLEENRVGILRKYDRQDTGVRKRLRECESKLRELEINGGFTVVNKIYRESKVVKVVDVSMYGISFSNGIFLESFHEVDCTETHDLYFQYASMEDFEGLEFDLSKEFFERIDGYGVRIPGYGSNNGYYSSVMELRLTDYWSGLREIHDISDCQEYDIED